ncbi:MAG TPA: hypothetical protein VHQ65_12740, partial [Thermoanaerobaculia bacterium]|nr:hypothetical protein [Thermoanaerobaculia bacterium]
MVRRLLPALLAALLAAAATAPPVAAQATAAPPAAGAEPEGDPGDLELEDRILALVDEEALLLSDVEQVIGLGLVERQPGETEEALIGRVLTGLVDQRLRFQEVERFGFERVSVDLVETQVRQIAAQFEDEAAFARRLAELEIRRDELSQLV